MIDLHCHTSISDGSLSSYQLLTRAKELGITHLAITNHDTTKGLKEAIEIAKELGIELIPGIEISAYDFDRQKRVHILGYYIDIESEAIRDLCNPLVQRRHQLSQQMVEILQNNDYEITWQQVEAYGGKTGVYKQHIMHALMKAGYCDDIYCKLYKYLFSRQGVDQKVGLAYLPLKYIDMIAAVKVVLESGGVPVLAHPGDFDNFAAVEELVEVGLQGIEVKHPSHNEVLEKKAFALASKFDLVITGGSDYHGFYGDNVSLGQENPGLECIRALERRRSKI